MNFDVISLEYEDMKLIIVGFSQNWRLYAINCKI